MLRTLNKSNLNNENNTNDLDTFFITYQCFKNMASNIPPKITKKGPYIRKGAHQATYLLSQRHIHQTDTWVQFLLFRYPYKFNTWATWWWQLLQQRSCYIKEYKYTLIAKLWVSLSKVTYILLFIFLIDVKFHIFLRITKCHIFLLSIIIDLHLYDNP